MNGNLDIQINYRSLIKFTVPNILANVFMSVYMIVDGIFVANEVSTDGLSAVNIVSPLVFIAMALGIMLGTGGSAVVAKQIGEGRIKEARENFTLIIITGFGLIVLLSLLGLIFCEPLLYFFGADDELYPMCRDYALPLLMAAPLSMGGVMFQLFLITEGRPSLGMAFSVAGGAVNIFLDWLLIDHLQMGLTGAALATSIGYCIPSMLGFIWFARNRKGNLFFVRPFLRIKILLKACFNGSSEMVGLLSTSVAVVASNNIMMELAGSDGVAAMTILLNTQALLTAFYLGYGEGIAPVVSFNFGRKDHDKLRLLHKKNLRVVALTSVGVFLLSIIFADPLVLIYTEKGSAVYQLAMNGYYIFSISYLFTGFCLYGSGFFTALNDGLTSALIAFIRTLVLRMICIFAMSALWGVEGLWVSMAAVDLFGMLVVFLFFRIKKDKFHYA